MHLGRLDHVLQAGLQLLAEDVDVGLGRLAFGIVVVVAPKVESQIQFATFQQLVLEG